MQKVQGEARFSLLRLANHGAKLYGVAESWAKFEWISSKNAPQIDCKLVVRRLERSRSPFLSLPKAAMLPEASQRGRGASQSRSIGRQRYEVGTGLWVELGQSVPLPRKSKFVGQAAPRRRLNQHRVRVED